jgi:hypothetical protein
METLSDSSSASEPLARADMELLRRCAGQAELAMTSLWDESRQTFWRSTEHRGREAGSPKVLFFPTVSLRCAGALLLLHGDAPDWCSDTTKQLLRDSVAKRIVSFDAGQLDSTLDIPQEQKNPFTLSLYVHTLSLICRFSAPTNEMVKLAAAKLLEAGTSLANHPSLGDRSASAHPFILYHACNALRAVASQDLDNGSRPLFDETINSLARASRKTAEALLAKHHLGSLAPSESVALAFCAGALSRCARPEDLPYLLACLGICLDSQDVNGSWPLGRVVRENKDVTSDKLEIPTFEIAAVVASVVQDLFAAPPGDVAPALLRSFSTKLLKTAHYAERSVVRLSAAEAPRIGWCTDHAYGADLIESWTSATVLVLMLSLRRLCEEDLRREILSTFPTVSPADRDWPRWLKWSDYRKTSEVDHEYPTLTYLDRHVIAPIASSPRREPAQDPRSVSVLLFGPPGTAKTTLVKAVAEGLGWPVVMLSPGTFIQRGLEYIEAQAELVFGRLMMLSRAVVLFDECDELFRDRKPLANTEQTRGITAFVTASMLPKLQELHDRGRVLFFVCTNNFDSMDPAVKRGGRIDHIVGIGPPDQEARLKIVMHWLKQQQSKEGWAPRTHLEAALEAFARHSDRFIRNELLRGCDLISAGADWSDASKAETFAKKVVERLEPGLTISDEELKKYRMQRKQYSRPVTEGAAR